MTGPLKISAISYLNTVPFVYGIKHSGILKDYTLTFDVPSTCAEKLRTGQADVGIVPVAAIPLIPEAQIVTDYCIGAVGPVKSVILVSMSQLDKIHTIFLDPDSRTSVQLVKILAGEYWKIEVQYQKLSPQVLQNLPEGTAAVIIGDKTFGMEEVFPVIFDLAGEWNNFTGLPFVFACWVSRGELPENFRENFNRAVGYGIQHLDEAIASVDPGIYPGLDIQAYFRDNISFPFDTAKETGLRKFLAYLNAGK